MRRLAPLSIIASILAGIVLFVVTLGGNNGAQAWGPGTPPPASPEAEETWRLDVEVPEGEEDWPEPYVTKVTVPAGTIQVDNSPHLGSFTFTVMEGAICYTYMGPPDALSTVIAYVTDNVPAPACAGARPDCHIKVDCVIKPGDVVYLPAGSWLTQSNTTIHRFGNVGTVPAVVYISGAWIVSEGTGPCASSCPRP